MTHWEKKIFGLPDSVQLCWTCLAKLRSTLISVKIIYGPSSYLCTVVIRIIQSLWSTVKCKLKHPSNSVSISISEYSRPLIGFVYSFVEGLPKLFIIFSLESWNLVFHSEDVWRYGTTFTRLSCISANNSIYVVFTSYSPRLGTTVFHLHVVQKNSLKNRGAFRVRQQTTPIRFIRVANHLEIRENRRCLTKSRGNSCKTVKVRVKWICFANVLETVHFTCFLSMLCRQRICIIIAKFCFSAN